MNAKSSWPESVGLSAKQVKENIAKAHPELQVDIVHQDAMVTKDFRTDRVRVYHDDAGLVKQVPQKG